MGRAEFESVIAQISREVFKQINSTYAAMVPATTGTEVVQIYSSPNTISKLITIWMSIPAPVGAASGIHVQKLSHSVGGGYLQGASNFADSIACDLLQFQTATSAANTYPTDKINQADNFRSVTFSDIYPLQLTYYNQTNVNQTGNRVIQINVIERQVGK